MEILDFAEKLHAYSDKRSIMDEDDCASVFYRATWIADPTVLSPDTQVNYT